MNDTTEKDSTSSVGDVTPTYHQTEAGLSQNFHRHINRSVIPQPDKPGGIMPQLPTKPGERMTDHLSRKEPRFSDLQDSAEAPVPANDDPEPEPESAMHPMAKLALLAIILACLAFVADRGYQRYQEYRLMQELQALVDGFEQSIQNLNEDQRAQQEQIRRNRAASSDGRWLAKNCEDWRLAHQNNPQPTSRTEMRHHCQTYERYLATGMAPRRIN